MNSDIESVIKVLSQGYYPRIEPNEMHDKIEKYFTCRSETYKFDHDKQNSENLALIDTIYYFSKQKQIKWDLN